MVENLSAIHWKFHRVAVRREASCSSGKDNEQQCTYHWPDNRNVRTRHLLWNTLPFVLAFGCSQEIACHWTQNAVSRHAFMLVNLKVFLDSIRETQNENQQGERKEWCFVKHPFSHDLSRNKIRDGSYSTPEPLFQTNFKSVSSVWWAFWVLHTASESSASCRSSSPTSTVLLSTLRCALARWFLCESGRLNTLPHSAHWYVMFSCIDMKCLLKSNLRVNHLSHSTQYLSLKWPSVIWCLTNSSSSSNSKSQVSIGHANACIANSSCTETTPGVLKIPITDGVDLRPCLAALWNDKGTNFMTIPVCGHSSINFCKAGLFWWSPKTCMLVAPLSKWHTSSLVSTSKSFRLIRAAVVSKNFLCNSRPRKKGSSSGGSGAWSYSWQTNRWTITQKHSQIPTQMFSTTKLKSMLWVTVPAEISDVTENSIATVTRHKSVRLYLMLAKIVSAVVLVRTVFARKIRPTVHWSYVPFQTTNCNEFFSTSNARLR